MPTVSFLKTPTIAGTTATTNGAVNVVALTKNFNSDVYVFAMGDGNATNLNGLDVKAISNNQNI